LAFFLLEMGWWGPDINERGYPNGATAALATYSAVILATVWLAERYKLFHAFGAARSEVCDRAPLSNIKIVAIFAPMAAFVLFGAGGIQTILGHQGAGAFRVGLTSVTGVPSYLILKCYAPATFAYVALERAKLGRTWSSSQTIVAGLLLAVISISFGYKTAILMAMLPAVTLLYWKSSLRTLATLAAIACCVTITAYLLMTQKDLASTFDAIFQRLFLWHGGIPWKIWDMYASGSTFPSYVHTLPSIFLDRLYTMLTGITRSDETDWVMAHFNLLATFIAGYTPEYIMRMGHNSAANAFSEGIMAYGMVGAFIVAVIAGIVIDALYHLIDNRLKVNDFAIASLAACYLFYALMPWLLGGGIDQLVHSSVIFGMLSGCMLLRLVGFHKNYFNVPAAPLT
jgi:oligosaccharide repeat unit polymerase